MNQSQCWCCSESLPIITFSSPVCIILQKLSILSSSLSNSMTHHSSTVMHRKLRVSVTLNLTQNNRVRLLLILQKVQLHLPLMLPREQSYHLLPLRTLIHRQCCYYLAIELRLLIVCHINAQLISQKLRRTILQFKCTIASQRP